MVKSCFVVGCKSNSRHVKVSYYTIPAIITESNRRYNGFGREDRQKYVIELSRNRQEAWIRALKRGPLSDSEKKNAKICEKHFISGKSADLLDENNPDWVPSQNLGYNKGYAVKRKSALQRYERYIKRTKMNECDSDAISIKPSVSKEVDDDLYLDTGGNDFNIQNECLSSKVDKSIQTDLGMSELSRLFDKLKNRSLRKHGEFKHIEHNYILQWKSE